MPLYRLNETYAFPPASHAEPSGLLAVGGDLSPGRLLEAYRNGIFPWFSEGDPILWWSPDPRLVLYPEKVHVSKSLKRTLKSDAFNVTFDTCFERVIDACAEPVGEGREQTWITEDMRDAYCQLHRDGYAHSVEVWHENDLAGGLYGVAVGRAFFGESMFTRVSDGSKVALVHLARRLADWGFGLIDCQMTTDHLLSMGAEEIVRADFLRQLEGCVHAESRLGSWEK